MNIICILALISVCLNLFVDCKCVYVEKEKKKLNSMIYSTLKCYDNNFMATWVSCGMIVTKLESSFRIPYMQVTENRD